MERKKEGITAAQLFTVIFILGMSLKMLMLPVLLLKSCGRDSVIALSGILISELVCLVAAVAAIMLSPQKSFCELTRECIGNIASKILFALLAVFFFLKLILLSGEIKIFFSENLFSDFSWGIFALPFFGLCAVIGMGKARALGRTAQFTFPFIAAAAIIMLVLIGGGVDYAEILPIGEFGLKNVSISALKYAMWYGDYSVSVVFIGCVKRTRHTAAIGITAGVASSVIVLLFTFGLTASFSNLCHLIRFGQNVTGMSHYALGNLMQGRFDLVLFSVWMTSVFIKGGIFSYAIVYFIRAIFPVNAALPSLFCSLLLYILSGFFGSATSLHHFMSELLFIPAFAVQFALPAFALITALICNRRAGAGRAKTEQGEGNATE